MANRNHGLLACNLLSRRQTIGMSFSMLSLEGRSLALLTAFLALP